MNKVDFTELNKFNMSSQVWWDLSGKFQALHVINPVRTNWIHQIVNLNNKKVLDVGCGGGILSESMALMGADVKGIDLSDKAIEAAEFHKLQSNISSIHYECISTESLAAKEGEKYDIITCMEMLEHVPNPNEIIISCSQLVKKNGYLFFSTLNRNLKSYLFAILFAEYFLKIIPHGTHNYKKFIKPSELGDMILQNNLQIRKINGINYNPLTKSCKISKNVDINYMLACIKL